MSCSVPGSQTGPSSSVEDLILEEPVFGRSSASPGSGASPTSLAGMYFSLKDFTLSRAFRPIFLMLPKRVFFSGGPETCSSSPSSAASAAASRNKVLLVLLAGEASSPFSGDGILRPATSGSRPADRSTARRLTHELIITN